MESAKEKFDKAKALMRANRFAEAEGQLRQAAALDKQSSEARIELARILGATGRLAECVKAIDEAIALDPDNADALSIKGFSLAAEQDYAAAIDCYRKAVSSNPNLAVAHLNLGSALRETDALDESEESLRRSIELDAKNFLGHYELAQTLAYKLKIKEAIHEVLEALKHNPYFVRGYLALAKLYQQGNELEDAVKILDQCLKTNPDAVEALELLTDFHLLRSDFRAAYASAERLISKRGASPDYMLLGNIALASGDFEKAEGAFKRSVELAPTDWRPHYALAELYDAANVEKSAGSEYESAVRFNDGSYEPHNGFGLYLLKQSRAQEAVAEFSTACKFAPDDEPTPIYNLALALTLTGGSAKAKELLETALEHAPEGGLYDEMRRLLNAVNRELAAQ